MGQKSSFLYSSLMTSSFKIILTYDVYSSMLVKKRRWKKIDILCNIWMSYVFMKSAFMPWGKHQDNEFTEDVEMHTYFHKRIMIYICQCNRYTLLKCITFEDYHSLSQCFFMMTSSNGNIFRVTGPSCGEFTSHQWIPLTNASDAELWCFLWSAPE